MNLVETLSGAHGALDVESAHVLPVLLEQRHQKVDGQVDVGRELFQLHADVADGHGQAQSLLHLELDGALQLLHLGGDVFAVLERRGKLAGLVQTTTQHLLQLLDDGVRRKESIIAVSQSGDLLLLLVQLLQVVQRAAVDAVGLGLVAVLLVTENAHLEAWSRHILKS